MRSRYTNVATVLSKTTYIPLLWASLIIAQQSSIVPKWWSNSVKSSGEYPPAAQGWLMCGTPARYSPFWRKSQRSETGCRLIEFKLPLFPFLVNNKNYPWVRERLPVSELIWQNIMLPLCAIGIVIWRISICKFVKKNCIKWHLPVVWRRMIFVIFPLTPIVKWINRSPVLVKIEAYLIWCVFQRCCEPDGWKYQQTLKGEQWREAHISETRYVCLLNVLPSTSELGEHIEDGREISWLKRVSISFSWQYPLAIQSEQELEGYFRCSCHRIRGFGSICRIKSGAL